jgi:protein arginine N-methyltransferase 1
MRSADGGLVQYTLRGYGAMIADAVRMDAYSTALARAVKPGAVVLDLGAGTGIMSLLACKLGASEVHAVEPSDAIAVGRELAQANGCADRIRFHHCSSFDLRLERRADVLVSDLRGVLPLLGRHVPTLVDARRRLLAPGAAQIPLRDRLRAQLVEDDGLHADVVEPWRSPVQGLDLQPGLKWATSQWRKVDLARSRMIAQPQTLLELDYRTLAEPDVQGQAHWQCEGPARAHGLGAWFDSTLVDGIGFSNAPDQPRLIYGQMFFPLREALELAAGDTVEVTLAARLVADAYVWQWRTRVQDAAGGAKADFRQSSFEAVPIDPRRLEKRSARHVPRTGRLGRAAARVLELFEQRVPLAAVAEQLRGEFPDLYAEHPDQAFELAADLSEWLSR